MSTNLWDFINFMLTEFITSLIIGYSRQHNDKNKSIDRTTYESADFNKNFNNHNENVRRGEEQNLAFINDLNDPLLDKLEKSLSKEF
jgi:hypothetical protein